MLVRRQRFKEEERNMPMKKKPGKAVAAKSKPRLKSAMNKKATKKTTKKK